MMTGVEILSQNEVCLNSGDEVIAIILIFFTFLLLVSALVSCAAGDFGLSGAFTILTFLFGFFAFLCAPGEIVKETQYKVTVSPEVPLQDFNARYEIISQEGKIYTVRDKQAKPEN